MSGIIINEDCNHFIYTRYKAGVNVTESVLRDFIHQYANTQVTDLMLNTAGVTSFSPSNVRETVLDLFRRAKEQGRVDESYAYCQLLCDLEEQGLDMYSIWLDQCRKDKITPWLSLRMNDCHCNSEEDHPLLSRFFYQNKHLRRVTHRKYADYFDNCLNFAHQEVRDFTRSYICECLEKYDIDGLELDWQRELYCFAPGGENKGIAIINDFMRDVKKMVAEAATRRDHPIKIGVRVAHSPIVSLKFGFDVMTWVKEKLVDLVVPSPRWETTDNDMSLDFWQRILEGSGVELAGGIDINLRPHPKASHKSQTLETATGSAIVNLSSGADKIYLFNFMDIPAGYQENLPEIFKGWLTEHNPCMPENYLTVLNYFGSVETLLSLPRRHVVSYHDFIIKGAERIGGPLPLEISAGEGFTPVHIVRIETGEIPSDKKITLIIAAQPKENSSPLSAEDFEVYVNSCPAEYVGLTTPAFAYSDSPHYAFAVKKEKDFTHASVAEFMAKTKSYTIDHVELLIHS